MPYYNNTQQSANRVIEYCSVTNQGYISAVSWTVVLFQAAINHCFRVMGTTQVIIYVVLFRYLSQIIQYRSWMKAMYYLRQNGSCDFNDEWVMWILNISETLGKVLLITSHTIIIFLVWYMLHSATSSNELLHLHTTHTQTSEVRWIVRFSGHWVVTSMFA